MPLMQLRRYGAGGLVFAVLLSCWAAPYSHLHRTGAHHHVGAEKAWPSDSSSPLVHSHFSPHQTTGAEEEPSSPALHAGQEEVLSLTTFLFEARCEFR